MAEGEVEIDLLAFGRQEQLVDEAAQVRFLFAGDGRHVNLLGGSENRRS
jgi:hypothetical protein